MRLLCSSNFGRGLTVTSYDYSFDEAMEAEQAIKHVHRRRDPANLAILTTAQIYASQAKKTKVIVTVSLTVFTIRNNRSLTDAVTAL